MNTKLFSILAFAIIFVSTVNSQSPPQPERAAHVQNVQPQSSQPHPSDQGTGPSNYNYRSAPSAPSGTGSNNYQTYPGKTKPFIFFKIPYLENASERGGKVKNWAKSIIIINHYLYIYSSCFTQLQQRRRTLRNRSWRIRWQPNFWSSKQCWLPTVCILWTNFLGIRGRHLNSRGVHLDHPLLCWDGRGGGTRWQDQGL